VLGDKRASVTLRVGFTGTDFIQKTSFVMSDMEVTSLQVIQSVTIQRSFTFLGLLGRMVLERYLSFRVSDVRGAGNFEMI
jgi:hypothetical protein